MFACFMVPDFPVQAVLRCEPEHTSEKLHHSPVAVLDGPANLPRVFALNDPARKLGIGLGMTKLQVETCGGVFLRSRSTEEENSAQAALLECASRFSPRVESTCPGTVILDLGGTQKLFGSPEKAACQMSVSARKAGLRVRIAIAGNPDTAMYAASGLAGITIVPSGEEAKTLAPLLVGLLPATPEMFEILDGWGIESFRDLAVLPTVPLVERLGQFGLHLQKLAQGGTIRPLKPVEALPEFVERYEFEDPVETLESLAFVLNRVLHEICDRLNAQALCTNELRLTLDFEVRQRLNGDKGERYQHEWKLPVPPKTSTCCSLLLGAGAAAAPIGAGAPLTVGRRTSSFFSLNLAGKRGPAARILAKTGSKEVIGWVSGAFELKLAADVGATAAMTLNCIGHR